MEITDIQKAILKKIGASELTLGEVRQVSSDKSKDISGELVTLINLKLVKRDDEYYFNTDLGVTVASLDGNVLPESIVQEIREKRNSESKVKILSEKEIEDIATKQSNKNAPTRNHIKIGEKVEAAPDHTILREDIKKEISSVLDSSKNKSKICKTHTVCNCPVFGRANVLFCIDVCKAYIPTNSNEICCDLVNKGAETYKP